MADDSHFRVFQTLRTAGDIVAAGLAAPESQPALEAVGQQYAIAITPQVAAQIDSSDPADPIARQFIPDPRELVRLPAELDDPIGDDSHSPAPGIVHRYPDRVLLKLLAICPVYCRFCFRREMVGPGENQVLSAAELEAALSYIAANPAIWEVIMTGGDPLMLSPRRIASLLQRLDTIPHVRIVRIHTRVPVVDSARVNGEMVEALKSSRKTVFVSVHANHPREISEPACAAFAALAEAGIALVSQTVLLRGVNDNADTLAQLMRLFVENRIKPYYLHHGDLAPGTSHFRTSIEEGQTIMRQLRGRLSGLAMPQYVLDIPGGFGKSPVGPSYLVAGAIADWRDQSHVYDDRTSPASGEPTDTQALSNGD